jgi:phosphoenolpyruvate carboxylase
MNIQTIFQETKDQLGKPYRDLEFLLEALKESLIQNGESEMAGQIPLVNEVSPEAAAITPRFLQLYSLIFQLINLCEINGAVQNRRKVEEESLDGVNGLWANQIGKLKAAGYADEEIVRTIAEVAIEPVLTAHPTEAKRTTVLEHYQELYGLVVQRENTMFNSYEQRLIRFNIKQTLYRLWKTGEIYLEKPGVEDELRNILHYLVNVFPEVIPLVNRRLLQAASYHGIDREAIHQQPLLPAHHLRQLGGGRSRRPSSGHG